jgi:hypothetical protein
MPRIGLGGKKVKQYLVVKLARETGVPASVVPVSGLSNRVLAEQLVLKLQDEEPDSAFFIQEVGAA